MCARRYTASVLHGTANLSCACVQARAVIIRAEGEAEGAQVISEALAKYGSGIIGAPPPPRAAPPPTAPADACNMPAPVSAHPDMRRIDAAREIAETMSRSPNVMYMPPGNMLMQMPMMSGKH